MLSLLLVDPKVFLRLWNGTIHFLNKVIFCKTYATQGIARERQIHVASSIMPSNWIYNSKEHRNLDEIISFGVPSDCYMPQCIMNVKGFMRVFCV
jgi:hypothetical protein